MQYRKNIKNNDELSLLGFGCMRYVRKGRSIDEAANIALLRKAIAEGVNYFDTAYVYHGGKSEAILGKALSGGYREKVKIATKLPRHLVNSYSDFNKLFSVQLEKLQSDYIDYYLIHHLVDLASWEKLQELGIEKWIKEKMENRQIRNFGFSFHGKESEFKRIVDGYPWDFCQIQYNYLDTGVQAGTVGLKYAAAKGLPIIIMEPLRGGKLANHLPKEAVSILQEKGLTAVELALSWLFNLPEVTVVLSGMNSEAQLLQNSEISDKYPAGSVSADQLALAEKVKSIINKNVTIPCTSCRYCMPCPFGVDIPACFNSYNQKDALRNFGPLISYSQNIGAFGSNPGNAGKCTNCQACIEHCPQVIQIPQELAKIKKELEGVAFKLICWGARIMNKTKKRR